MYLESGERENVITEKCEREDHNRGAKAKKVEPRQNLDSQDGEHGATDGAKVERVVFLEEQHAHTRSDICFKKKVQLGP